MFSICLTFLFIVRIYKTNFTVLSSSLWVTTYNHTFNFFSKSHILASISDMFTLQIHNTKWIKSVSAVLTKKYVGFRWKTKRKNQWRFVVWCHTIGNSLEESTYNDTEMNRSVGRMDGVEIRRICTFFSAHESNINQTLVFKVFEDLISWYLCGLVWFILGNKGKKIH